MCQCFFARGCAFLVLVCYKSITGSTHGFCGIPNVVELGSFLRPVMVSVAIYLVGHCHLNHAIQLMDTCHGLVLFFYFFYFNIQYGTLHYGE